MKTVIEIEIEHQKGLPAKTPVTDVVAQRLYGYLYSQGVEAGVTARVMLELLEDEGKSA